MSHQVEKEDSSLLDYIKSLENKNNTLRGQQVELILKSLGIEPSVQECNFLKIKNIIVDFSPGSKEKRLLFTAHYDAVKSSPGANDNASGVAVLLGLCRELKNARLPVRIAFFDREEACLKTPFLRLGLLGSLFYVLQNNIRNIAFVYNLEFCGFGDCLSIWPIKREEKNLPAVKVAEAVACNLKIDLKLAHIPWLLFSSDHLSFRFRGITNAVTLTLLPASQLPVLEKMISGLSVPRLLMRKKPLLPEPLSFVHTPKDTSSRLSENSLRFMLSIVLEIVRIYTSERAA